MQSQAALSGLIGCCESGTRRVTRKKSYSGWYFFQKKNVGSVLGKRKKMRVGTQVLHNKYIKIIIEFNV